MATAPAPHTETSLQTLVAGFESLQDEHLRIQAKCRLLEHNLSKAKEQYEKLCQQSQVFAGDTCPHFRPAPLDLLDVDSDQSSAKDYDRWLQSETVGTELQHQLHILEARKAIQRIRRGSLGSDIPDGVSIHSGPSADRPARASSSAMPSISESPLEQDFTVPGTPSQLGCPFASMANRRLSKHAASVVSRYRNSGTVTPRSSASLVNGRVQEANQLAADETDNEAERCAMASPVKSHLEASVQGSTGMCPIRFIDKDSPEAVAAYFEEHKHEIPRSHEHCVKRYQSNEESIRELDAKYGNLVSMIQGLGHKHQPMLPEKVGEIVDEEALEKTVSHEKVERWAQSIHGESGDAVEDLGDEGRLAHFDRPLNDVRLGESPSRPWGIQVPLEARRRKSEASSLAVEAPLADPFREVSKPAQVAGLETPPPSQLPESQGPEMQMGKVPERCPFGRGAEWKAASAPAPRQAENVRPVFLPLDATAELAGGSTSETKAGIVFSGPVFFGYSPEQAIAVLQGLTKQTA